MKWVNDADAGPLGGPLPAGPQKALAKAIHLEWITIGFLVLSVVVVGMVAGQSQAMQAAWAEDSLSLLPPIAFLIAARVIRIQPSIRHPYGHHRSIGVAHLVAGTALLLMGSIVLISSLIGLISLEKPPVGTTVLFGHQFWAGWLMIAVMVPTAIIPVILGRMKLKLAEELHDKVLRADADMNKADWSTAVATIIGVLGIGIGLWWLDAAAAILVAASIVFDGVTNVKASIEDLTDTRATRFDDSEEHPLIDEAEKVTRAVPWVRQAAARVRDQGHVFHVEMFVIPEPGQDPSLTQLMEVRRSLLGLHWKIHDVAVIPVGSIPGYLLADEALEG
ncbi:cation transporter [Corynebacterium comes]|uniref:Cation efflux family protein n=1 Tax=Corynebacterium comes TaxID=2675218 RepID=A0A6B8W985_9CORY|nr:cation transporter [Corynebacterium comes]QGU03548.1 Cation efflux family protein [Corynebacterium comes]